MTIVNTYFTLYAIYSTRLKEVKGIDKLLAVLENAERKENINLCFDYQTQHKQCNNRQNEER